MALPTNNIEYAKKDYWDERYEQEEEFEWCSSFDAFRSLIWEFIRPEDRILMLGCGNSRLSADLYNDGFHNITNMDYSDIVINNMRKKHGDKPLMTWVCMDIKNMDFKDNSFDIVLEKATLDSLLVGEKNPWRISIEAQDMMDNILTKISSILKPTGKFISITFAQPHFRKVLYAKSKYDWSIETRIFGEHFHFFYYIMTKGKVLSGTDIELVEKYFLNSERTYDNHPDYLLPEDDENFLIGILLDEDD